MATPLPRPVQPVDRIDDHLPEPEIVVVDPDEHRRAVRRARRRRWRTRLVVLLVVSGCAALGTVKVQERLVRSHRVDFREVLLTADPVDVISTSPGNVLETMVRPGEQVAEGGPRGRGRHHPPSSRRR